MVYKTIKPRKYVNSDNYYYDGYLNLEDMETYVKSQYGNYTFESDVKE